LFHRALYALYNGIGVALARLEKATVSRRVLLIISDGADNSAARISSQFCFGPRTLDRIVLGRPLRTHDFRRNPRTPFLPSNVRTENPGYGPLIFIPARVTFCETLASEIEAVSRATQPHLLIVSTDLASVRRIQNERKIILTSTGTNSQHDTGHSNQVQEYSGYNFSIIKH
jgi:hypothetical protein